MDLTAPPRLVRIALFTTLACTLLTGCEDSALQFETHLAQLQSELGRAQIELQDARRSLAEANEELQKLKGSNTSQTGGESPMPDKAALEEAYTAAAQRMKSQVVEKLKGFTVESCTLHTVRTPENLYPFTSDVALALRSAEDQKPYRVDFPVKADFSGKWIFPGVDEIVARIEAAKNTAAVSALSPQAPPAPSPSAFGPIPAPIMESNGTVVIQWPDSPRQRPVAPPSPVQAPLPALAPSSTAGAPPNPRSGDAPAAVMPVNRDVLIKF